MSRLFEPLTLRELTLRNRIAMSPMCTYSCEARDGQASDWHLQHLASRAAGGLGLVLSEAVAVAAGGRISPEDLGLYDDEQVAPLRRIAKAVRAEGAAFGVQLAHAGRKAGCFRPWDPRRGVVAGADGGWPDDVIGPTAAPFGDANATPRALDGDGIASVVRAFAAAAARADAASADVLEIHAAHGYLLHTFLSPLTNARDDGYGGDERDRARLLHEVVDAVRTTWPEEKPLFVRLSATDWVAGGWDVDATVRLSRSLADRGVDLIDCSAGGAVPGVQIDAHPNYQVAFAERVRREAGVASGAVGAIADPLQAEAIVAEGRADLVLLGKALLRQPYWPIAAAKALGAAPPWPRQYAWAVG